MPMRSRVTVGHRFRRTAPTNAAGSPAAMRPSIVMVARATDAGRHETLVEISREVDKTDRVGGRRSCGRSNSSSALSFMSELDLSARLASASSVLRCAPALLRICGERRCVRYELLQVVCHMPILHAMTGSTSFSPSAAAAVLRTLRQCRLSTLLLSERSNASCIPRAVWLRAPPGALPGRLRIGPLVIFLWPRPYRRRR